MFSELQKGSQAKYEGFVTTWSVPYTWFVLCMGEMQLRSLRFELGQYHWVRDKKLPLTASSSHMSNKLSKLLDWVVTGLLDDLKETRKITNFRYTR